MRQTEKAPENPGSCNSNTRDLRTRDPRYDCLRAVSVMAIIMVHAMPVETASPRQWWFNSVMTPFLLSFVGIYFMLSGMFLLERGTGRIGEFYRKRLITVARMIWPDLLLLQCSCGQGGPATLETCRAISGTGADSRDSQGRPYVVHVCHRILLYMCTVPGQDG